MFKLKNKQMTVEVELSVEEWRVLAQALDDCAASWAEKRKHAAYAMWVDVACMLRSIGVEWDEQ